jgi:hypothetical protein
LIFSSTVESIQVSFTSEPTHMFYTILSAFLPFLLQFFEWGRLPGIPLDLILRRTSTPARQEGSIGRNSIVGIEFYFVSAFKTPFTSLRWEFRRWKM